MKERHRCARDWAFVGSRWQVLRWLRPRPDRPRRRRPFRSTRPGRLPKNVVPIDYTISIVPDAARLTLSGTESVVLDFRQASATIVFNSLHQTLNHVQLDGQPVKSTVSDDKQQLTTLTLAKPAAAGRHKTTAPHQGQTAKGPQ